jgi:hypothetical protein
MTVSERGLLLRPRRLYVLEFLIALFDAARPLVPGKGGADMVGASALACRKGADRLRSGYGQARSGVKASTLTPEEKAILRDARKKAVEAVKKDDDATCNKVITEAMTRAGLKM